MRLDPQPDESTVHTETCGIVPIPHSECTGGPQDNSHGCAPSDQQPHYVTIEAMDEQMFLPADPLADVERMARQVGFNMPASWEEMEALGLNPLTGEPS